MGEEVRGLRSTNRYLQNSHECTVQYRKSQTRWMQRGPRHIIIKIPKVKDEEKILKAAREKKLPAGEFP